jgi:hypothetical protein
MDGSRFLKYTHVQINSIKTSLARNVLIYIDCTTGINKGKHLYPLIRNEKVACSIHVSGTKIANEITLFKR